MTNEGVLHDLVIIGAAGFAPEAEMQNGNSGSYVFQSQLCSFPQFLDPKRPTREDIEAVIASPPERPLSPTATESDPVPQIRLRAVQFGPISPVNGDS